MRDESEGLRRVGRAVGLSPDYRLTAVGLPTNGGGFEPRLPTVQYD
jgi:hypothetical protein